MGPDTVSLHCLKNTVTNELQVFKVADRDFPDVSEMGLKRQISASGSQNPQWCHSCVPVNNLQINLQIAELNTQCTKS